jgi:hypothetical protein
MIIQELQYRQMDTTPSYACFREIFMTDWFGWKCAWSDKKISLKTCIMRAGHLAGMLSLSWDQIQTGEWLSNITINPHEVIP